MGGITIARRLRICDMCHSPTRASDRWCCNTALTCTYFHTQTDFPFTFQMYRYHYQYDYNNSHHSFTATGSLRKRHYCSVQIIPCTGK